MLPTKTSNLIARYILSMNSADVASQSRWMRYCSILNLHLCSEGLTCPHSHLLTQSVGQLQLHANIYWATILCSIQVCRAFNSTAALRLRLCLLKAIKSSLTLKLYFLKLSTTLKASSVRKRQDVVIHGNKCSSPARERQACLLWLEVKEITFKKNL